MFQDIINIVIISITTNPHTIFLMISKYSIQFSYYLSNYAQFKACYFN